MAGEIEVNRGASPLRERLSDKANRVARRDLGFEYVILLVCIKYECM